MVSTINYPPEVTGIAPYAGKLVSKLAERHVVSVITAHPHYPEWKIHSGFGQWKTVTETSYIKLLRVRHYVPRNPIGLARLVSELSFGLRSCLAAIPKAQAIVLVSPALFSTAMILAKVKIAHPRTKSIVWVQDIYSLAVTEITKQNKVVQVITKWVEAFVLNRCDHLVLIHDRFADYVQKEFSIPADKVTVIQNWTHMSEVELNPKSDNREQFGWGREDFVVVHSGNMGRKQGLTNVIEAAKKSESRKLPFLFVFLGNGSEMEALKILATGLRNVQFHEALPKDEYQSALAGADALLVSQLLSVSDVSVPSKLTSYFFAGKPVIASVNPGGITASEVVAAGAGLIVQAEKPENLIDALLELYRDPARARVFGINAKKYATKKYSESDALSKWESVAMRMVSLGAPEI